MPLIGTPPRKAGWSDTIAVRRPPADQRPDEEPIAVEAEIAAALAKDRERATNFSDDVSEARLRRQRIADDFDPVGARPVGEKGEHVLVVALPITTVNEHEQRRLGLARGEVIEPRARAACIGNIETRSRARRHGPA